MWQVTLLPHPGIRIPDRSQKFAAQKLPFNFEIQTSGRFERIEEIGFPNVDAHTFHRWWSTAKVGFRWLRWRFLPRCYSFQKLRWRHLGRLRRDLFISIRHGSWFLRIHGLEIALIIKVGYSLWWERLYLSVSFIGFPDCGNILNPPCKCGSSNLVTLSVHLQGEWRVFNIFPQSGNPMDETERYFLYPDYVREYDVCLRKILLKSI